MKQPTFIITGLILLNCCTSIQPTVNTPISQVPLTEADKQNMAERICGILEYAVYEESTESFRTRLKNAGYYWKDTQAIYHLMDGDGCYPTRLFILTPEGKLYVAMAEVEDRAHLGTSVEELTKDPENPYGEEWHCTFDADSQMLEAEQGKLPAPGIWAKLSANKP